MLKIKPQSDTRQFFIKVSNKFYTKAIHTNTVQTFLLIGRNIKEDITKHTLKKNKTGRVYTIYIGGRKVIHRASSENDRTYASITGETAKGIQSSSLLSSGFRIGYTNENGRRLELQYNRRTIQNTLKKKQSYILTTLKQAVYFSFKK